MAKSPVTESEELTEAEIAKRRDEVIRRMANTKPKSHKAALPSKKAKKPSKS